MERKLRLLTVLWIALYIGYAAIVLTAIEDLRIDNRLKNVVIRLGNLNQMEVYVA